MNKINSKTLKIGLTGGIGTGKSTVTQYFSELGVPIIDADLIAHELLENNVCVRKCLIEYFGKEIMLTDKTTVNNTNGPEQIDRKKLRAIVFNDPKKLKWLEDLLHPLIEREMLTRAQKITYPYCIFVIPLLLEKQKNYLVDRILTVYATQQQQIERTMKRDQTSDQEAEKIINTQLSQKKHLIAAHDIINNDGSLQDLCHQVKILHEKYLALAKIKVS